MTNCKNCNTPINSSFCHNCGQAASLKRIDSHYIIHELQHLLHFEKGFPFTVKKLFTSPGQSIKEYITENRNSFIKPVPFLIFTSLIYTLVNNYFHIERDTLYAGSNGLGSEALKNSNISHLYEWVQTHYGYANILMGGLIALLLKLFFRKYNYNIFEITVLLCFVMGEGMLLLAVFSLLAGLTKIKAFFTIMSLVIFFYISWAIGQFYDSKKTSSYVKAFLSYMLGSTLFFIILTIIGLIADYLKK
jgi:hypothetical protein